MFNLEMFRFVNSLAGRHDWLDWFMIFSAERLGYLMITILTLLLIANREKFRDMFLLSLGSAIVSRFIFVEAIRYFYYNPRPFEALQNINQLISHELKSSFPSGHASFYFALAMGVYLHNKKIGLIYLTLAVLIGIARIYVGVHWPLDIIVGAGLGVTTTFIISKFTPLLIK